MQMPRYRASRPSFHFRLFSSRLCILCMQLSWASHFSSSVFHCSCQLRLGIFLLTLPGWYNSVVSKPLSRVSFNDLITKFVGTNTNFREAGMGESYRIIQSVKRDLIDQNINSELFKRDFVNFGILSSFSSEMMYGIVYIFNQWTHSRLFCHASTLQKSSQSSLSP